jgi:hypothetical protein
MEVLNKAKSKMLKGYIYILVSYVAAFIIALTVGVIFNFIHTLLMIFLADLAATFTIFLISSILKNASFYNPF